jgi:hypothetical protein
MVALVSYIKCCKLAAASVAMLLILVPNTMCVRNQKTAVSLPTDTPVWTEKQVIDHLYGYLTNQADRLQSLDAEVERIIINAAFESAVCEANSKFLKAIGKKGLGEGVTMRFGESSLKLFTWISALNRIATYSGNASWHVNIKDWQWKVNETTEEVTAENQGAIDLLTAITLKTYVNHKYGYRFDYPPSWTIDGQDQEEVLLTDGHENVNAFVSVLAVSKSELATFHGLQGYTEARLAFFKAQYCFFIITDVSSQKLTFMYQAQTNSSKCEGIYRVIPHNEMIFEVMCSGKIIGLPKEPDSKTYWSVIYDPYGSFTFQP